MIAVMAIVIVVILILAYWFFIRSSDELDTLALGSSTTAQIQDSTPVPRLVPTAVPTAVPTPVPTPVPTIFMAPTIVPTTVPTPVATLVPTPVPTAVPTTIPTPTPIPTLAAPALPLPSIVNDNPPHVFVGTATIGGQPAQDGTEVTAWVLQYADPVGTSIIPAIAGQPGSYSLLVPQYGNDFSGTVLTIKIDGNFVTNVVWKSGEGTLKDLAR
mgnify:CR=1 FL=1